MQRVCVTEKMHLWMRRVNRLRPVRLTLLGQTAHEEYDNAVMLYRSVGWLRRP